MYLDLLDARRVRPAPQRPLDPQHGFVVSFDQSLDASIGKVAHVAVHSFDRGMVLNEIPETDALHAAADHEELRNDHRNG